MPDKPRSEPFQISVADDVLDDLSSRLRRARWAEGLGDDDWYYGVPVAYLHALVDYWINEFDWRAVETKLNEFAHYRVTIDGDPVHFMHRGGVGTASKTPIILNHGWPWTFWDWSKVIHPLADPLAHGGSTEDVFDVVVPSLPGFGFSTPSSKEGLNFVVMADMYHTLMTDVLGYGVYAAAGCDHGVRVAAQLGHKYADEVLGIHLGYDTLLDTFQTERPWDATAGQLAPSEPPHVREGVLISQRTYAVHVAVQMLESQTLAHGLSDSPVGLLAWLLQRWHRWSDQQADFEAVFPRDHVLTSATIYWVNNAIAMSMRIYANMARYPWQPSHDRTPVVEVPAGFTFMLGDSTNANSSHRTPEERLERFYSGPGATKWYNPIFAQAVSPGGHFCPWENPNATIHGIRETFRRAKAMRSAANT